MGRKSKELSPYKNEVIINLLNHYIEPNIKLIHYTCY